jgi:hypothetical protein
MTGRQIIPFMVFVVAAFLPTSILGQTENSPLPVPAGTESANSTSADRNQRQGAVPNSGLAPTICGITHPGQCFKDLGHDQAGIWTSPLRLSPRDTFWLVPFAAATGVALHYDVQAQQELGIDKSRIDASNTISDVGLYGSIGGAGGLYLLGWATHDDHLAETGRLGGEAIINALLVVEALKLATNRERPNEGNGRGGFWPHGTSKYELDGSFPSGHAAVSWAFAQVIASEFPSKPIRVGAYAFALGISASRVTAREHFPSDVLVGGTFGYLIGKYVVQHHQADRQGTSTFSVSPLIQESTRTVGLHVEFTPDQVHLSKVAGILGRVLGTR